MKVTSATEAASVKLNAEGKITKFTTGYVVDRSGNTGGLGALFGIMRELLWLTLAHFRVECFRCVYLRRLCFFELELHVWVAHDILVFMMKYLSNTHTWFFLICGDADAIGHPVKSPEASS